MKNLLLIILFLSSCKTYSQFEINGSFENLDKSGAPKGWLLKFSETQNKAYKSSLDSSTKQDGKYSMLLEKKGSEAAFGAITYPITQVFEGKTIELKAYLKTQDVSTGYAGLYMRIDDENSKIIAFDNMGTRGVKETTDWKQYSIKLDYNSEEVKTLYIGGLLSGDGKAWFDNFELFIDGLPINSSELKKLTLPKAKTDTTFVNGSKINDFKLDDQITNNLVAAGQFWGFLKYHHPTIAKGELNWDAELFRLLPTVISAKNNTELSTALENFLDKLPKPKLCKDCKSIANEKYEIKPDYGLLFDKKLFKASLLEKLEYVKENRNTSRNYYVQMEPGVSNPNFNKEVGYMNMKYPDVGYRLLSLYRYWSIINYFFPYRDVIGQDWNGVLKKSIPEFVDAKNELDYAKASLKLIASINDTHANLWSDSKALNDFKGKYAAPLQTTFIENKLV
ncbi:MAG: peptidase S41, partial [Pedobacter sp.]